MKKRAEFIHINDVITLINDANEATYYLICGDKKALLIDTGWGYDNVMEIAREITALPIEVINTHGHIDHVYGNMYCEKAWMHPDDFIICENHFKKDYKKNINDKLECCPLMPLENGQIFDLGGFSLEIIELSGHTKGSICLLDRKHRILFSGDTLNSYLWAQLDESLPLSLYKKNIEKFMDSYQNEFDYHLSGHTKNLIPKEAIYRLIKGFDEIIKGDTENDNDYEWFEGIAKAHSYGNNDYELICYNNKNI